MAISFIASFAHHSFPFVSVLSAMGPIYDDSVSSPPSPPPQYSVVEEVQSSTQMRQLLTRAIEILSMTTNQQTSCLTPSDVWYTPDNEYWTLAQLEVYVKS